MNRTFLSSMRSWVRYIIPLGYLLIVAFCVWRAMYVSSDGGFDWFGAGMALTFPWSIVTFFLILGFMQVLGDNGIYAVLGVSALINAGILFRLFRLRSSV